MSPRSSDTRFLSILTPTVVRYLSEKMLLTNRDDQARLAHRKPAQHADLLLDHPVRLLQLAPQRRALQKRQEVREFLARTADRRSRPASSTPSPGCMSATCDARDARLLALRRSSAPRRPVRSPCRTPAWLSARRGRHDERLVAAHEARAREDNRLQQVALAADLADRRQVRAHLSAAVADRVTRRTRRLRAVEERLPAPDVSAADHPGQQLIESLRPAAPRRPASRRAGPRPRACTDGGYFASRGRNTLARTLERPLRLLQRGKHRKAERFVARRDRRPAAVAAAPAGRPPAPRRRAARAARASERPSRRSSPPPSSPATGCCGIRLSRRSANISSSTAGELPPIEPNASSRT